MRITLALTIYVSLAAGARAENVSVAQETTTSWRLTYDAGLEACQHGGFEQAISIFEKSWDGAKTAEERGASANNLAYTYRKLKRDREAATWFDRARLAWKEMPTERFLMAAAFANLADIRRAEGDYKTAEALLREGLAVSGSDAESTAVMRNGLADLLREQGRGLEAKPLFEATTEDTNISLKERTAALVGLADLDRQDGNTKGSVDRWSQVLEMAREGKDRRAEATALNGLATAWSAGGSPERAEPLLRKAVQMFESAPDTPPEQLATALSGLAGLYRGANKLALAENSWSRALEIDRKVLGEGHPQVAYLMEMLAELFSARGEFTLAQDYATRAARAMAEALGEDSMAEATALSNRALVEERASRLTEAAGDYAQAIQIAQGHPGNLGVRAVILTRYAGLLKAMHREKEAKLLTIQARAFMPKN